MSTLLWIIIFGFLMSCIALVGSLTIFLRQETWNKLILPLVAFSAGSLIGGAMFHMIPAAVEKMGNKTELYCWLCGGFMVFYALEEFLNWHHSHTHSHSCSPFRGEQHEHHFPQMSNHNHRQQPSESETHLCGLDCGFPLQIEGNNDDESTACSNNGAQIIDHKEAEKDIELAVISAEEHEYSSTSGNHMDERSSTTSNPNDVQAQPQPSSEKKHPLVYLIIVADAVHNFLGGMFVGASFVDSVELGVSAWLAAAAHEVPQELGDFAVLVHGGWSRPKALLMNFSSALTFPLGGLIAYGASKSIDVAFMIPFAAGNFLYIGGSDLIPEVKHFHGVKRNSIHFASFTLGTGIMLGIRVAIEGW